MDLVCMKIKKTDAKDWYILPDILTIKTAVNSLHSHSSGRDNNLGNMFIDKVSEKQKFTATLKAGISSTEMVKILDIIMSPSFDCYLPNPRTGKLGAKTFFNATGEAEIRRMYNDYTWDYKAFTFSLTEM